MADANTPQSAPNLEGGKVDRGQRESHQAHLTESHDGKQRADFVQPKHGALPPDMTGNGDGPAPATTQDVTESPPSASAWEAIEADAADPTTPARRGRDPARTQDKA